MRKSVRICPKHNFHPASICLFDTYTLHSYLSNTAILLNTRLTSLTMCDLQRIWHFRIYHHTLFQCRHLSTQLVCRDCQASPVLTIDRALQQKICNRDASRYERSVSEHNTWLTGSADTIEDQWLWLPWPRDVSKSYRWTFRIASFFFVVLHSACEHVSNMCSIDGRLLVKCHSCKFSYNWQPNMLEALPSCRRSERPEW